MSWPNITPFEEAYELFKLRDSNLGRYFGLISVLHETESYRILSIYAETDEIAQEVVDMMCKHIPGAATNVFQIFTTKTVVADEDSCAVQVKPDRVIDQSGRLANISHFATLGRDADFQLVNAPATKRFAL